MMKSKLLSRSFFFDRLDAVKGSLLAFGLITLIYNFLFACTRVMYVADGMPLDDVLGLLDYAVLLRYFVTVALPIITSGAFAFANDRSSTDFYMCLPFDKGTMARSTMLASFIGGVSVVTVSALSSTVVVLFGLPYGILLDPVAIICEFLALIVVSAMAVAVSGLISSATGKRGTAIISSFLLLTVPRIVMFMLNETLVCLDDRLVIGRFFHFFDNEPNLFTALFVQNDGAALNILSYLYSAAIAFVAAWFAGKYFKSRSGEHVGRDFALGSVQGLTGLLLALLLFAFGFIWICTFEAPLIILGVIVCGGGVAVLLTYATSGFKKRDPAALRAIPVFFITVAVYIGIVIGGHFAMKSYSPGVDEIKSVSIVAEIDSTAYMPMHYSDYVLIRADGVGLTDSRSVGAVANALDFDDKSVNNSNVADYVAAVLKIETVFGVDYRCLWLPLWEYEAMLLASTDTETMGDIWLDMTSELIDASVDFGGVIISGAEGRAALSTLESEIREVGTERWYETVIGDGEEDVAYITATVRHDGRLQYVYIPVPEYATRTLKYIEDEAAKIMRAEYDDMKLAFEDALSGDGESIMLYIYLSAEDGGEDEKEIAVLLAPDDSEASEIVTWLFSVIEPVYGDYAADSLTVDAFGEDIFSDVWFYQSYKLKAGVTRKELLSFFAEHGN